MGLDTMTYWQTDRPSVAKWLWLKSYKNGRPRQSEGGAFHWGSQVLYEEETTRREFRSHSELKDTSQFPSELTEEGDRHTDREGAAEQIRRRSSDRGWQPAERTDQEGHNVEGDLEGGRRRREAVEDSSEWVHVRIQEAASAKLFPVIVICCGCNLERINPVPIWIHVVIIDVTTAGTWNRHQKWYWRRMQLRMKAYAPWYWKRM
jgi:hypothetical protein